MTLTCSKCPAPISVNCASGLCRECRRAHYEANRPTRKCISCDNEVTRGSRTGRCFDCYQIIKGASRVIGFPSPKRIWCAQCETLVRPAAAARCASQFCKAEAA